MKIREQRDERWDVVSKRALCEESMYSHRIGKTSIFDDIHNTRRLSKLLPVDVDTAYVHLLCTKNKNKELYVVLQLVEHNSYSEKYPKCYSLQIIGNYNNSYVLFGDKETTQSIDEAVELFDKLKYLCGSEDYKNGTIRIATP